MKILLALLACLMMVTPALASEPPAALSLHPPLKPVIAPVEKEEEEKPDEKVPIRIPRPVIAVDVIEGPIIRDSRDNTIHPLQLIGEVRDKRAHWYTPRLGEKHYVYTTAENKYHYVATKKIPLVFDARPWGKRHPIIFGGYEICRVSAGAVITGGFAWAAARK